MADIEHSAFEVRYLACIPLLVFVAACDSALIEEAEKAENNGRTINNEVMQGMYPHSFRPGSPAYLERDFEAGADLICDEIRAKYQRDICSEPEINWR